MRQPRNTVKLLVAGLTMSALIVSSASADAFKAGQYPVTLTGAQSGSIGKFVTTAGSAECTTATLAGTVSGDTQEWAVTPTYSGCACVGVACTIDTNGCGYRLKIGAATTGTLDIVCPAGNTITFTNTKCVIHIGSQTGVGTVTYSNSGSGTTQEVIYALNLSGLKYSHTKGTGIGACTTGSGTTGTWTGTGRMTGEQDPGSNGHIELFIQ